jgi:hypothetical protein
VGFRLENGEYLPTKVFVRGNFGVGEQQLERMLMKRLACLWVLLFQWR